MSNLSPYQFNGGNTYVAPNGKSYTMKGAGTSMVTAHTPSGRKAAAMIHNTGNEPEKNTVFNIHVSGPHRRKGLGTAMLDYARATGNPDLHHSTILTEDGEGFAAASPRPWQPKLPLTPDNGGERKESLWKGYVDFGPKNERSRQEYNAKYKAEAEARNRKLQGEQLQLEV